MTTKPKRLSGTQRGVTLIEVLVTMLLLMFGLLGVAGLMVKGLSNAVASESMSKANQLLADMADRLRANSAVAASASSEYLFNFETTVPTGTPASIALRDKQAWLTAVQSQLPLGDAKITSSGTRKLMLQIRWAKCLGTLSDADQTSCKTASASTYQTVSMEVRL